MRPAGRNALGLLWLAVALAPSPLRASEAGAEYAVRPGDSLWSIAAAELGDASLWPALYRANRDRIKDPARVYPGQALTIPEISDQGLDAIRREAESLLDR